jgi:hypothetical protein
MIQGLLFAALFYGGRRKGRNGAGVPVFIVVSTIAFVLT